MPSRDIPSPPPPPIPLIAPGPTALPLHHHQRGIVPPLAGGVAAAFSLLLVFTLCFRKLSRKRTVPADSKPPHRFSYSDLRRATSSFASSRRLGQGGFGSVYSGTLTNKQEIAVKLMDAGSLQGEREFQNELFFGGTIDSNHILSVIGFSSDRKRRRMLLVYELMTNGSLQDCLLHRKCSELMTWNKRFSIALDIAKGLEYLHHYCDPPVIHGDIKPSNILLNRDFNAKIGDFGLARVKQQEADQCEIVVNKDGYEGKEDNGSVIEETESVITTTTCLDEFNPGIEHSPESFVRVTVADASPETVDDVTVSPGPAAAVMPSPSEVSLSESNFDGFSVESGGKDVVVASNGGKRKKSSLSGKDWWWKQDNGGGDSGSVKDYVMEWIGSEIKKERPIGIGGGASSSSGPIVKSERKNKKNRRRLDWWVSLDEDKNVVKKKDKRRPTREWWKEEYCEELARKKKKKMKKIGQASTSDDFYSENFDEGLYVDRKNKKRSRSRSGRGSIDWWLDGLSGELWKSRRNSHDSGSGEIPRSGGISSTPSMRGTVCYVAPEYKGDSDLSEKCDVYSFGVVLLVLIAGRRPLQVTGSPMAEYQRANLLSWARRLARAGKLLDLVDKSVQCIDREQAMLCITVALLCLQKSPARRPSMKGVVAMFSGDIEPPQLPVELSPSRIPSKSHKKVR